MADDDDVVEVLCFEELLDDVGKAVDGGDRRALRASMAGQVDGIDAVVGDPPPAP